MEPEVVHELRWNQVPMSYFNSTMTSFDFEHPSTWLRLWKTFGEDDNRVEVETFVASKTNGQMVLAPEAINRLLESTQAVLFYTEKRFDVYLFEFNVPDKSPTVPNRSVTACL